MCIISNYVFYMIEIDHIYYDRYQETERQTEREGSINWFENNVANRIKLRIVLTFRRISLWVSPFPRKVTVYLGISLRGMRKTIKVVGI